MASVKWLTRIYAVREPFQGYWQTSDYAYWDSVDGKPVRRPLGEIKLKSEIFRPRFYEKIAPNQTYTVFGAAWTVESEVTAVSVSTDGGQTWDKAEFLHNTHGADGNLIGLHRTNRADAHCCPEQKISPATFNRIIMMRTMAAV